MANQQVKQSQQDTGSQVRRQRRAPASATRQEQNVEQRSNDSKREALRPPVDVFEDEQSIVLTADLPGVASEGLHIEVDGDNLLIEGEASLDIPEEIRPLYAEVRNVFYRRSFALSSELNTDEIDANLKNGILTLRLPKRAEARPRKIEVKAS